MDTTKNSGPSAGGQARALLQKEEARLRIEKYNSHPHLCLECQGPIIALLDHKLNETLTKRFCTRSCAAVYNNKSSPKRPSKSNKTKVRKSQPFSICQSCGIQVANSINKKGLHNLRKFCDACSGSKIHTRTKGEIFSTRANWQSARSSIRNHACKQYQGSPGCDVCGYERYTEVCHLRPVADFPDSATLGEINHPNNLTRLCPNHHWELDHPA
jgi:hypothetical protein